MLPFTRCKSWFSYIAERGRQNRTVNNAERHDVRHEIYCAFDTYSEENIEASKRPNRITASLSNEPQAQYSNPLMLVAGPRAHSLRLPHQIPCLLRSDLSNLIVCNSALNFIRATSHVQGGFRWLGVLKVRLILPPKAKLRHRENLSLLVTRNSLAARYRTTEITLYV